MITSLRHPRKRTVSIGPQSAADAYETLAFRERRRRESRESRERTPTPVPVAPPPASSGSNSKVPPDRSEDDEGYYSYASGRASSTAKSENTSSSSSSGAVAANTENLPDSPPLNGIPLRPVISETITDSDGTTPPPDDLVVAQVDTVPAIPPRNPRRREGAPLTPTSASFEDRTGEEEDEREELRQDQAMFRRLLRPRVRYDVEVVTKLIVYTGIGWLATAGGPILFELCGLGLGEWEGRL